MFNFYFRDRSTYAICLRSFSCAHLLNIQHQSQDTKYHQRNLYELTSLVWAINVYITCTEKIL